MQYSQPIGPTCTNADWFVVTERKKRNSQHYVKDAVDPSVNQRLKAAATATAITDA